MKIIVSTVDLELIQWLFMRFKLKEQHVETFSSINQQKIAWGPKVRKSHAIDTTYLLQYYKQTRRILEMLISSRVEERCASQR